MANVEIEVGSHIEYKDVGGVNCIVVTNRYDGKVYASRLYFEPIQDVIDAPIDMPVRMPQLCAALVITANKCGNGVIEQTLSLLREEIILQCA